MSRTKLIVINFLLGFCFLGVLTYAVGLTVGIGTDRVIERFNTRLWDPLKYRYFGDSTLEAYEERPCPAGDSLAVAYFGQSNATNTVFPPASIQYPENLLQFDWKSQRCYAYQEPLLGADFEMGNSITYVAAELAQNTDRAVVVIPFGFGPSSVLNWGYGQGALLHELVLERIQAQGFSPQLFLWHQGETDAAVHGADAVDVARTGYFKRPDNRFDYLPSSQGLSRELYRDALDTVVERTFSKFPDAHFGIALASLAPCLNRHEPWQPLRQAQQDVADAHPNAFISADSDAISGQANRHDSCHFSQAGAKLLSQQYHASITALDGFEEFAAASMSVSVVQ